MRLIQGDCLERLKELEDNSIDAIVTDPPYELGFMGKEWDNTGIANNVNMWKECLRVLKPGGHLLSFGGTRTYHRMASAIEDAGFEIRDMIEWVYGSGFPKSLNIGKAVDKLQGKEPIIVGKRTDGRSGSKFQDGNNQFVNAENNQRKEVDSKIGLITKPATPEGEQWEGWGTALKPAHEPICMARKPLAEKTVAENCLKWGTGGINIDESRVEPTGDVSGWSQTGSKAGKNRAMSGDNYEREPKPDNPQGRFPANLIHDNSEEVRECFPETKKMVKEMTGEDIEDVLGNGYEEYECNDTGAGWFEKGGRGKRQKYTDNNTNASRFFKSIIYTAKASKSERNKGCEGLDNHKPCYESHRPNYENTKGIETPYAGTGRTGGNLKNNHPTVKPIALMEYLINMVTREGQVVLDPFMGSGSTGVSCINLNRDFIGIELEPDYIKIAEARIKSVPRRLL